MHPFDLDTLPFEPSRNVRTWWTSVRKEPMTIGGINLTGLFRIDKFAMDFGVFILVAIFELTGLSLIAISLDNVWATIIAVLIGITIDAALVYFHHRRVGANCHNKNKIIIADQLAEDLLRASNQEITPIAISNRAMGLRNQCEDEIKSNVMVARWL